ncbi:MAG TPA: DUF2190 family protein [Dehalococcoidia bacterium]
MAKNRAFANARKNYYPVASGVLSGDPTCVGQIPGVALTDRDAAGYASLDTGGAYSLEVEGQPAAGDILYWHSTKTINATSSGGTRFGYAMQTIASGTATIPVKLGY